MDLVIFVFLLVRESRVGNVYLIASARYNPACWNRFPCTFQEDESLSSHNISILAMSHTEENPFFERERERLIGDITAVSRVHPLVAPPSCHSVSLYGIFLGL